MPNTELLERTLRHIKDHQNDWIQRQWITPADEREDPSCGTAYCFAGWAVALSGYKIERTGNVRVDQLPPEMAQRLAAEDRVFTSGYAGGPVAECGSVAAVLLGIRHFDGRGGCHLFCGHNSLDDLTHMVAKLCAATTEPAAS